MTDDQGVPPDRFAPEPIVSEIGAIPDRGYAPFSFDEEHDMLIFQFSREEFVKVLSSLRNGAYMTYGDEGSAVYWSFLRNVDYPIMICASIIDCITNDSDTQQALNDFILTHPDGTKYPRDQQLPSGVSGGNLLSNNPDCDPDILYAQCVGTVETALQLTTDFLNQWQVYNASGAVAAAIIQAIPGVGIVADASGVEGVIEYANAIADSIQENFNADNTLDYREQLACAFFCAAQDDCNLSIDDCLTILQNRLTGELSFANVAELFLSLLDANVTGINVADLYLCAFFGLVKLGNWLLPVSWGVDIFAITISTFDTPNNDWIELCTDCPAPWCIRLDATNGLETAFTPSGGAGMQAQWGGDGWERNPLFPSRITIHGDLGVSAEITTMRIVITAPVNYGELQQIVIFTSGFGTALANGPSTDVDAIYNVNTTLQEFEIDIEAGLLVSGPEITAKLIVVEISGTGTAPTIGTVCE